MLRKLKKRDAEGMLEWMHDPEIQKNFQMDTLHKTYEDVVQFIQSASDKAAYGKSMHYAITDEKDEYLGTISLKDIDMTARKAEYAIALRKKAHGKGVGMAATRELLRIAFEEIGLERVYLNVLSENERAIHLYEKCGFSYEGEFRKHLFLHGKYYNLKYYGILKEEYEQMNWCSTASTACDMQGV